MQIEKVDIDSIKINPKNPRIIKNEKYKKLKKSIIDFPDMLEVRPLVVDDDMIVLGGNMRLKACKDVGLKEVPIIRFKNLTDEQKNEFILKDNQSFGDWDFNALYDWNKETLLDSGFEEFELLGIFGGNHTTESFKKKLEADKSINPEPINIDDYVKQNILFFNELMIEFEDEEIKRSIKNIENTEDFLSDIKKIIFKYGKNSL